MSCSYPTLTHQSTHIGYIRSVNEDALFVNEKEGLWVVADGMGGHSRGDKASRIVVDHCKSYCQCDSLEESIKDIEARLSMANQACRSLYDKEILGSTVAALLIFQSKATLVWAGDSRIYRLREGTLNLITEDHNLAQERCRRGEMSQDEAQRLPSANVLTRAVGVHQDLRLQVQDVEVAPRDRYLLSTDGLYRELTHQDLQDILREPFGQSVMTQLISKALDKGGKDNITGVLVEIQESATGPKN